LDTIAKKLSECKWIYAPQDPIAYAEIEKRIIETGQNLRLITYTDLVKGIEFHLPNVGEGGVHRMNIAGWTGLDRHIIGDFLGQLSCHSYCDHGFMANALVVNKNEYKPSPIFFNWMQSLDVLQDTKEDTILRFWAEQVNKAHNWYRSRRVRPLPDTP